MKKPTAKEIEEEIAALEACKAYAPHFTAFGDNNHEKIDRQIEFLRGDIDTTAGEFEEFSEDERSAISEAEQWQDGDCDESPSSGWAMFKKAKK
jgi:hypothetical protein